MTEQDINELTIKFRDELFGIFASVTKKVSENKESEVTSVLDNMFKELDAMSKEDQVTFIKAINKRICSRFIGHKNKGGGPHGESPHTNNPSWYNLYFFLFQQIYIRDSRFATKEYDSLGICRDFFIEYIFHPLAKIEFIEILLNIPDVGMSVFPVSSPDKEYDPCSKLKRNPYVTEEDRWKAERNGINLDEIPKKFSEYLYQTGNYYIKLNLFVKFSSLCLGNAGESHHEEIASFFNEAKSIFLGDNVPHIKRSQLMNLIIAKLLPKVKELAAFIEVVFTEICKTFQPEKPNRYYIFSMVEASKEEKLIMHGLLDAKSMEPTH